MQHQFFKDVIAEELANPRLEYNMKHKHRGLCLLINQKKFKNSRGKVTIRKGTDEDAKRVTDVFGKLGFDVRQHNNLEKKALKAVLFEGEKERNKLATLFVFLFLPWMPVFSLLLKFARC